jgi:hypothetical protein
MLRIGVVDRILLGTAYGMGEHWQIASIRELLSRGVLGNSRAKKVRGCLEAPRSSRALAIYALFINDN